MFTIIGKYDIIRAMIFKAVIHLISECKEWLKERPWAASAIIALTVVLTSSIAGFVSAGDHVIIERRNPIEQKASQTESEQKASQTESLDNMADATDRSRVSSSPEMIQVYVVGGVVNPGIVEVEKGSLVALVIEKAGGFSSDADRTSINAAFKLNSNAMVIVGLNKQELNNEDTGVFLYNSVLTGDVLTDSRGVISGQPGMNSGSKSEIEKVNINTADENMLKTLPGVGTATAKDILIYREANGSFKRIEDIMKISGIKQAKFDKMKDYIIVE